MSRPGTRPEPGRPSCPNSSQKPSEVCPPPPPRSPCLCQASLRSPCGQWPQGTEQTSWRNARPQQTLHPPTSSPGRPARPGLHDHLVLEPPSTGRRVGTLPPAAPCAPSFLCPGWAGWARWGCCSAQEAPEPCVFHAEPCWLPPSGRAGISAPRCSGEASQRESEAPGGPTERPQLVLTLRRSPAALAGAGPQCVPRNQPGRPGPHWARLELS